MRRLRSAGPVGIGVTRLIPGVRTYATLVAGAAHVETRRFAYGALPALLAWLVALTAIGALVGLPAARLMGRLDAVLVSGGLLLLLGVGAFLVVRHMPPADETQLTGVPERWRLLLALCVDLGVVASLVTGIVRFVARLLHPGHPLGRVNDLIVVTAVVVIGYVAVCRRTASATLGEGLVGAGYRVALRRLAGRRPDDGPETLRPTGS
jgi:hypothetical protein